LSAKLQDELAATLRDIYHKLDLLHDEQSEVTPKELALLTALTESGPTRVKDLADSVGLPLSTVSWTADKMVGRKLLSRKTDRRDRRVIRLTLSATGRAVLANHNAIFDRLAASVWAVLDASERETVVNAIKKLTVQF